MAKWYMDTGFQNDIVLSTRVRLARNLQGIAYPCRMNDSDAQKVVDTVKSAIDEMNYGFEMKDISKCTPIEKNMLVESRYISPIMAKQSKPCATFVSDDGSVSIMVNEEDHIRMQSIFAGLETKKAYDLISKIDTYIGEKIPYSVHSKYGYLTSCLTNVGTGMRVSVMMHLPAICKFGLQDGLFSAIGKLGFTVRGMYGEGSKSSGYIFQISNQMTLGVDEKEIIDKLNDVANQVIAKERELRAQMLKQQGTVLEDKIMRAEGILKSARILTEKEMNGLFSYVRLGISLGLICDIDTKTINSLSVEATQAYILADKTVEADSDVLRANMVREALN